MRNTSYRFGLFVILIMGLVGCSNHRAPDSSTDTTESDNYSIGYYGNNVDTLKDLETAINNHGDRHKLISTVEEDFTEDSLENLVEQNCEIIVVDYTGMEERFEQIAAQYKDIQFVLHSAEMSETDNVIIFYTNEEEISRFMTDVENFLRSRNVEYREEHLSYTLTYIRIFEEILTVYDERESTVSNVLEAGISTESVTMTYLDNILSIHNLTDAYAQLIETYTDKDTFIYD